MDWNEQKIRSEDTWGEVRRAWEGGETGASLARRYGVGLANLWRRRASENWRRPVRPDPAPEPIEGWDRWGQRKRDAFELALADARSVALTLVAGMRAEGPPEGVPLWHVGFVLAWRAEHLGPETAAKDRAWVTGKAPWAAKFWDDAGRLWDGEHLDWLTASENRDAWREEIGLPEGAAKHLP